MGKWFTGYPCNLRGETIFSELLLPARREHHRTRCKYVIRCNMMAVIIRVFYDHGMNFPLKAPAYYLVTRYHVNGKATRLYKARYLENYKVLIYYNSIKWWVWAEVKKATSWAMPSQAKNSSALAMSSSLLILDFRTWFLILVSIVILASFSTLWSCWHWCLQQWCLLINDAFSLIMPPHQWRLLINDTFSWMMPSHQWCYSSTLPPHQQCLLIDNASSSTKLPKWHFNNDASSSTMPPHYWCLLMNNVTSWMMLPHQCCLLIIAMMPLFLLCVGWFF